MNTPLVDALAQAVLSLSPEERQRFDLLLAQEPSPQEIPLMDASEPSTQELMRLGELGGSFNFLYQEPNLYTIEDGEPV